MSKSAVNFILDLTLAMVFLAMLWLQFSLRFLFPAPGEASGWRLWGFGYDDWTWLDFWITFVFGVLVLIHVMLHWSWVCGFVVHRLPKRNGRSVSIDPSTETLIGVAILVGVLHVLGALYLAAMLTIEPPPAAPTQQKSDGGLPSLLNSRALGGRKGTIESEASRSDRFVSRRFRVTTTALSG